MWQVSDECKQQLGCNNNELGRAQSDRIKAILQQLPDTSWVKKFAFGPVVATHSSSHEADAEPKQAIEPRCTITSISTVANGHEKRAVSPCSQPSYALWHCMLEWQDEVPVELLEDRDGHDRHVYTQYERVQRSTMVITPMLTEFSVWNREVFFNDTLSMFDMKPKLIDFVDPKGYPVVIWVDRLQAFVPDSLDRGDWTPRGEEAEDESSRAKNGGILWAR